MSSILADQWRPRKWAQMWGKEGVAGSQPMSTAVLRSPNKLWRSNSMCDLWFFPLTFTVQHSLPMFLRYTIDEDSPCFLISFSFSVFWYHLSSKKYSFWWHLCCLQYTVYYKNCTVLHIWYLSELVMFSYFFSQDCPFNLQIMCPRPLTVFPVCIVLPGSQCLPA